jgi:thioredoxin-related protein
MASLQRRPFIAIILLAFSAGFIRANAQNSSKDTASGRRETPLPTPPDMRISASAAQRSSEPLVILLSLPGCPWCELLRRNYLAPMRSEGLHAFQWNVQDRQQRIMGFQGEASTGWQLAQSYRYQTTPTVLFLNAQGEEIAPRIEGVASADFLGAMLDERLSAARQHLKKR